MHPALVILVPIFFLTYTLLVKNRRHRYLQKAREDRINIIDSWDPLCNCELILMMPLYIKSILLTLIIFAIFSQGLQLQLWQCVSFFLHNLVDFLFSKDYDVVRVRKIEQTEQVTRMNNGMILDFIGLVERHNYPAEEHSLITEDGYNLMIHRIPGSPLWRNKEKKKVVFIQHGLLASSDCWVLFGPGKDLVFLLADQGYDVWIGNVRGNSYCRSHINLTVYDREFWQFSFHEIGVKDLPAMVDYILNYTGQKSLRYIGHSMGGTVLFVFLSSRPEYNAKIEIAICLSPVAFWLNVTFIIKLIIVSMLMAMEFLKNYKLYNVFPQSSLMNSVGKIFCNDQMITQSICTTLVFLVVGFDPMQFNTTALPDMMAYWPSGTSTKNFEHYYQNIVAGDFRNFDYGVVGNLKQYKQKTPPSYDIRKITAPTAIFYSINDFLNPIENIFQLISYLPNIILMEEVPFKFFNHLDFVIALDAKTFLYDRVIQVLREFDANRTLAMK